MPKDDASEGHWKQYGPGATGAGWDMAFLGLGLHVDSGGQTVDQDESNAWMASDAGKVFLRASADAWGTAHVNAGEDAEVAKAMAKATGDFYTGA